MMNDKNMKNLINLYKSSNKHIGVFDANFILLWCNFDFFKCLSQNDFYEPNFSVKQTDYIFENKFIKCEFPILTQKTLLCIGQTVCYYADVLPFIEDSEALGYVITLSTTFETNSDYKSYQSNLACQKLVSYFKKMSKNMIMNTQIICDVLDEMEEYELSKENYETITTNLNISSSFANLDEYFSYLSDIFNENLSNASNYISDVLLIMSSEIKKNNIKFSYDIEENIFLKLDYNKLLSVVLNLVVNAIFYNNAKTKIVSVSFKKIGSDAVLTVTDNGEGIPPEKIPFLFEPFALRDNVKKHEALGLPLTMLFAKKYDGNVIHSTSSKGFSISLRLPIKEYKVEEVRNQNAKYLQSQFSSINVYLKKCFD